MQLWQDLQDHWHAQEALAEELAVKHGKTVKWMKKAVLHVGKYGASPRKVAPHNAWLHAKSLEINPNLNPGEKENVIALQRIAKEAGSWRDVPKEEMDKMMRSLEAKHALVKKGICAKPLSQMAMVHQLVALGQSCKTSSLCVTVWMAPHHLNVPMFAADDISKDFIEIVLGGHGMTERKEVALNNNDKAVMTHRWVCGKITCALCEITGNPTLDMSWKNYKKDIVDEYHIILEGWPSLVFDPSKLGFKDGICKWWQLTDDEFTARKNEVAANGGDKKKVQKERRNGKTGTIKEINVTVGKLESILSIVLDMYQKIWRLDKDFGGRAVLAVSNDGGGWTHNASTSDICHAQERQVVADLAESRQSDGLIKALQ
ncbi:hypothetical protein K439DRAFT_1622028 [Ramaria rubella]|nr:hypothetical protein K439DRAFT_1622028 [Ramaria rubella]